MASIRFRDYSGDRGRRRRRPVAGLMFSTLMLFLSASVFALAEETESQAAEGAPDSSSGAAEGDVAADKARIERLEKKRLEAELYELALNKDWGGYYDPQNEFCGKYDCYKILGLDWETFGSKPPERAEITKRYRMMSRAWHPDKNREKGAKERFVKINKAYEILTDTDKRAEYDYLRDRPDDYIMKYGSSVLWSYAPKSDARFIIVLLVAVGSAFTYFVQRQRWQTVADRIVKAAVEGLGAREGGSTESIEVRKRAEKILADREAKKKDGDGATNGSGDGGTPNKGSGGGSSKRKMTPKERKQMEQETLRPIIVELVNEMEDFGGGFHKPTWRDLLVVKVAKMPLAIWSALFWQTKYAIRRLRKLELNEEEREVLTRRAVGDVAWAAVSDEDRKEMVTLDLWETANLEEWRERQEVKKLGAGYQKRYNRWKKKQGSKLA